MDLELKGKTALITGGSKGIGRGVAEVLAEEGCNLILVARTHDDLMVTRAEIVQRTGVHVITHELDLSLNQNIEILSAASRDADILINNAGAIPHGHLHQISDETLRAVWDLKLFGYLNLTRHIYSIMKERGRGVIVNIIGGAGQFPSPDYFAGAGANGALTSMTIAFGKESTLHGVRILGLHPGPTRSERLQDIWETQAELRLGDRNRWQEVIPPLAFNRPVEPREVGQMVAFLASAKCSYSSGVVYSLAGGR